MASVPGQQQPTSSSQPPGPPGSQQQHPSSVATIQPGPPSSSGGSNDPNLGGQLSWEGDRMFNIYIYDYCSKRGFRKTAKELLAEAEIPPESQPPINARQGLLFEWWSVFWVLFTAKNNKQGTEDAMIYIENQNQQNAMRQANAQRQNQPQMMAAGPAGPNGMATRPGSGPNPAPGVNVNGIPPSGPAGMPRQPMPNGIGPGPVPPPGSAGFQPGQQPQQPPPHLINGMPNPGPGPNPGQPPNQQFTPRPPGAPNQSQNNNPNARPGQPGQQPFASPTMPHSPPGSSQGPPQQRGPGGPQGPGIMVPVPSPHMGQRGSIGPPGQTQQSGGMLPPPQGPHGQQGPGSGYPMNNMGNPAMGMGSMGMGGMGSGPGPGMVLGRSPSRSGDTGPGQPGMMNPMNPSPLLGPRQPPGPGGGPMGGMGGNMMGGNPMASNPMGGSMMGPNMGMGGNMMGGMGMPGGGGMMSDTEVQNILNSIPQGLVLAVRRDAGIGDKDMNAMSMEEKRRVATIYRAQYANKPGMPPLPQGNPGMGPGPSNMGPPHAQPPGPPGPGQAPQMQQRGRVGGKRNSATGEEADSNNTSSPPDPKRRRRSPMEGTTPQNQQHSPMSYPAQAPGQASGPGPGPVPGPGANMLGRSPMSNPGFTNPAQGQGAYRNQMHNLHKHAMPQAESGPFNTAGRKPGAQGMMMPPSQNPGMGKDPSKEGAKPEGSPRNMPGQGQGQTPTNTAGTASSTPVLSQQSIPPPPNSQPTPQSQGPTPQPNMTAPSPSAILGTPVQQHQSVPPPPVPQQPTSVADMFSNEFMQSVANQLEDFETGLFRPDGDINFERDFGQWFNHPDDVGGGLEMK